jgi:hypothetical protein
MSTPSRGELPIIQATTDLIRWFVPLLNRLPRDHRFALGDRLVGGLYDLLEGLVTARYSSVKLPRLESLAANLDLLQIQTRLLHDFHLIDEKRYEHDSRAPCPLRRDRSAVGAAFPCHKLCQPPWLWQPPSSAEVRAFLSGAPLGIADRYSSLFPQH